MTAVEEIKKNLKHDIEASQKEVKVFTDGLQENLVSKIENRLEIVLRAQHKSNELTALLDNLNKTKGVQEMLITLKTMKNTCQGFLERGAFNVHSTTPGRRISMLAKGEVYGNLIPQLGAYIEWIEEEEELQEQKK